MRNLLVFLSTFCIFIPPSLQTTLSPKILLVFFVRNKEHTLPHFLRLIEDLDYPKERISFYIRCDHNEPEDASPFIISSWTEKIKIKYNYHSFSVNVSENTSNDFPLVGWTPERFRWMMKSKEEALEHGRAIWADWIWFLDADVFITDPFALKLLLEEKDYHPLIAPMLKSVGLYSNFWAGMSETYYYERTKEYEPLLERKKVGCHLVPMVHSCFLINLNHEDSKYLTFIPEKIPDYDGPEDDIIVFALSAKMNYIPITVCNERIYGYIIPPLDESKSLEDDTLNLLNLRLETISSFSPRFLPYLPEFKEFVRNPFSLKDTLGVDHIYSINLKRRKDRRKRMEICYDELGIQTEWTDAVDGKTLTQEVIDQQGIKMMPGFLEPYHERPIKFGEIGCFLSHYNIWMDIVEKGYDRVIIFEDDIRFEPFFRSKLERLLEELDDLEDYWDLTFLGRKILHNSEEPWVEGSEQLVHVDYTYWTLSYIITFDGAKKLLEEKPLGKMVPVDEYLPIMYDRHPNQTWKNNFKNRNLKALSAHPLLVHPTHYTGDEGYISDTEDSMLIKKDEL
ncbi:glycosyltransferase 25 family member [Lepeophtheirus salmonis]|uniref:glycosyltransferase 25 family member n=1 Tax=Lepeophtheirus salmonis TaxID=72036 RepID=UPI001AEA7C9F|nr:glycosyltransferase 25 family member-like [Lepeophtheirus salmonis]